MESDNVTVEPIEGNEAFSAVPALQSCLRQGETIRSKQRKATGVTIVPIPTRAEAEDGPSSSPASPATLLEANVDTPSSEYEAAVCKNLEDLNQSCKAAWVDSLSLSRVIWRSILLDQNYAIAFTSVMLVVSCCLYPVTQTILCMILFFFIYGLCIALQTYHFWARVTETRYRTASVMSEVLERWWRRIHAMPTRRSLNQRERRRVFMESFAFIPSKAFRMIAVVDDRTDRLKHIHKSLVVKRSKRLDEATLKVRRFLEPTGICKLVDAMRVTLDSDAIVLRPLTDKARPPRLPNFFMSSAERPVEDEVTSDDSDGEHESRTALGGGNSISVSHHMEYFVHRVFLLVWAIAMVLTVGTGVLFYFIIGAPLGEGVFLDPAVALLGLLPLNAIVLNRVLIFYANVYLEKLFHSTAARRTHSVDDRLQRFSFLSIVSTMMRVVLRMQPPNGGRNPLVFSNSLVEVFGMSTVIAMLDQKGIVTDMVPVPVQVLLLKADTAMESSSSSEEDNEEESRGHQRKLRRQVRRKKYQENRFVELGMAQSSKEDMAVEFADNEKLWQKHSAHLNPLCLCILVHAMAREPPMLDTWTEPFRFCDRSFLWARALHWLPRACGFQNSVVNNYLIVARIFQVDTRANTGYRQSYPEQSCSFLVEAGDGIMHLFTLGTPYMVCKYSTTHWTGGSVEEFDEEDKVEVVHMGKHVWEEGASLETVALSHRVLPERYRKFVTSLPHDARMYREYFFRDGVEVNSETVKQRRERRAQAQEAAQRHARARDGNPRESLQQLDEVVAKGGGEESSRRRAGSLPPTRTAELPRTSQRRALSVGAEDPDRAVGHLEEDDCLTAKTFIAMMSTVSHTFLGLVGIRDSVRPNVESAMSVLDGAGVRCMYFCQGNERQTKSFGSRVGLETDWNCCISLKEDEVVLDPHSIRAQLPFGIKSIRKHILHVDPIPLQVNLFSHALGVSKRAMISVLQDNHEVVIAVGSVFNYSNARSFVQADMSIGVLPTRRGANAEKESTLGHGAVVEPSDFAAINGANRDIPLYRNVAELIGCSCSLRVPPTTCLMPLLATMIRQARLRLSGIGNGAEFVMHANFFLVTLNTVSLVLGAPLLTTPTMTVCELYVLIPLLAMSCTYTAYAGMDSMRVMPSRHNYFVRLAIFKHSAIVWMLRYLPSVIALVALGVTASMRACKCGMLELIMPEHEVCLSAGEGYTALTFTYWLMVHCWTHVSRHNPISLTFSLKLGHGRDSTFLFRSFRFMGTSIFSCLLTVVLVLADTPSTVRKKAFFPSIPHFLVSLLFPIAILAADWPIKRWRERRFNDMQKFRKLSFGTRLGMHSPRGDYEPEGVTYTDPSEHPVEEEEGTRTVSLWKRLSETFYRFTSMRDGKLELNCVCCDHIGGNYATYHTDAKV